jgi:hypothetical protein
MTRDESAGLRRIIKNRPEWQGRLQRAAKASATIASMCGGYEVAGRGLEHWQATDEPDSEAKLQDLLLLQAMLERLLQHCLECALQAEPRSLSSIRRPQFRCHAAPHVKA